jgi:hypothetical protein
MQYQFDVKDSAIYLLKNSRPLASAHKSATSEWLVFMLPFENPIAVLKSQDETIQHLKKLFPEAQNDSI